MGQASEQFLRLSHPGMGAYTYGIPAGLTEEGEAKMRPGAGEAGGTRLIRAYRSLSSPGPLPSPPTAEVFTGFSSMSSHSPQEAPLPFGRHLLSSSSHDQVPRLTS